MVVIKISLRAGCGGTHLYILPATWVEGGGFLEPVSSILTWVIW
jgi:hypothetical protein